MCVSERKRGRERRSERERKRERKIERWRGRLREGLTEEEGNKRNRERWNVTSRREILADNFGLY